MLEVGAVCVVVAAVMLAYAPSRQPPSSVRGRLVLGLGAVVGCCALAGARAAGGDTLPLMLALALVYVPAAVLALMPRFRQSPEYLRARPLVWAWSLVILGLVTGTSLAMRDDEVNRETCHLLGRALEDHRARHGSYPVRLEDAVRDVPRMQAGWRRVPIGYASDRTSYSVEYPTWTGVWTYCSQKQEWEHVQE